MGFDCLACPTKGNQSTMANSGVQTRRHLCLHIIEKKRISKSRDLQEVFVAAFFKPTKLGMISAQANSRSKTAILAMDSEATSLTAISQCVMTDSSRCSVRLRLYSGKLDP